ncbi:MAG: hypothetical protein P8J13_04305 [Gammaproteobacteria bacterium]|jgi:hypothetical protein|nr:hypothetical protein [Gammaproteobacteria bacterium]
MKKTLSNKLRASFSVLENQNIPYPLYINEIRFNEPQKVSTMDYLTQKLRFEKHLNID